MRRGAAAKTVFPHITTDPEVCSGRPRIAGTRIRVIDIVAVHEQGVSPGELQNYFDTRPPDPGRDTFCAHVLQRPQR